MIGNLLIIVGRYLEWVVLRVYSVRNSAQEILVALTTLQFHGPFDRLDLSKQPWADSWSLEEWRALFQLINNSAFNRITTLNLSASRRQASAISEFLEITAQYLQNSIVQQLDLSGQLLSLQGITALLPGLANNTQLNRICFSRTAFTDTIFSLFLSIIPTMPSFGELDISGNFLTGYSLNLLGNTLTNTNISSLDLSFNRFTALDINRFQFNTSSLQSLNISGADLSAGALTQFGSQIINSSLINLIMDYCQLSDSVIINLFSSIVRSTISTLSLAGNFISYQGMRTIANNLLISGILSLNLNDNYLDDNSVVLLTSSLNSTNNQLASLSLSGNLITAMGFNVLFSVLNQSRLNHLELSRCDLGDGILTTLNSTAPQNFSLTSLSLSHDRLTSQSVTALFYYLANSSLTNLDVSGNFLQGIGVEPITALIHHTNLQKINLRQTQIDNNCLHSTWSILKNSQLNSIDISENNADDSVALSLAENLIAPVPNQEIWLDSAANDIDFARSLNRTSPQTALQQIIFQSSTLTAQGARALCLVAPSSGIDMVNLDLAGDSLNPELTGINGCPCQAGHQTSGARLSATSSEILMIGLLVIALRPQLTVISTLAGYAMNKLHQTVKGIGKIYQKFSLFSFSKLQPRHFNHTEVASHEKIPISFNYR